MLSDRDGLLDQVVQVLWDRWSQTFRLEDSEDLVTSDESDLGNSLRVSQLDTNLRWGETLSSELEDLIADLLGCGLEPRWGRSTVWEGRRGDTLSFGCESREVAGR